MAYIIKRLDQAQGYVAPEGSRSSYVRSPHLAKLYPTKEAALRDLCRGNEVVEEFAPSSHHGTA